MNMIGAIELSTPKEIWIKQYLGDSEMCNAKIMASFSNQALVSRYNFFEDCT